MIRSARPLTFFAGVAIAALAIVGCGSDSSNDSSNTPAVSTPATQAPTASSASAGKGDYGSPDTSAPATGDAGAATGLTIKGFSFSPLTVTAGEEFTITNEDSAKHTVTADDGTFSVEVPGGATETLTIAKAGTYAIHCEIHSSMKGTIIVN